MHEVPANIRHCAPEFRLLVASSWIAPEAFAAAQTEEILACCQEKIDWPRFVALARRHGIVTIVDTMLRRVARAHVPAEVFMELKPDNLAARFSAALAAHEMARICALFLAEQIEVLPLKGSVLSQRLFQDPGMRHVRDIDLLIHSGDFDRARLLLEREGYECEDQTWKLTPAQLRYTREVNTHLPFRHLPRKQWLELHWGIDRWQEEQLAELWTRHKMQSLGEITLNVLDDDILFIFLCDHGSRHQWEMVKWMSDIAMLLAQKNAFAWPSIVDMARRMKCQRSLATGVLLIHWWYHIPLPEPLAILVQHEAAVHPVARYFAASMMVAKRSLTLPQRIVRGLRNLRADRCLFGSRFPVRLQLKAVGIRTSDFITCPLPDRFFWLYYVLRPFLWLRRRRP